MGQSLAQLYVHTVFSTKQRRPFLHDPELRSMLHAYLAGCCRNHDSPAIKIGGTEDHVHVLCRLARTISTSNLVRELKRASSAWVKQHSQNLEMFRWQDGYGAFSVSPSHVSSLTRYIENQMEHHRIETFQDELRRLLEKYEIDFDERYVWD